MFSERSAKRGASASAEAAAVDAKIATTTEPAAAVCVTTEAAAANPIIEAVQDVTTEAKTNVVAEAKMLRCVPIPAIAPCVDRLPPDATGCHWVAGATFALDVGYLSSGNNKTRNGNAM